MIRPARGRRILAGAVLALIVGSALGLVPVSAGGSAWTSAPPLPDPTFAQRFGVAEAQAPPGSGQAVLLYGGCCDGNMAAYADTFGWDGSQWTDLKSTTPGQLAQASMAYDADHRTDVLFGGQGRLGNDISSSSTTWTWDGATWTAPDISGPPSRSNAAMAFDPVHHRVVLVGGSSYDGQTQTTQFLSDTWLWDGGTGLGTWTQDVDAKLPALSGASMAWDPLGSRLLLFGGAATDCPAAPCLSNATYAFDGAQWTVVSTTGPPARAGAGMATYTPDCGVVLFGGVDRSDNVTADTWAWRAGSWRQETTPSSLTRRTQVGLAENPANGTAVMYGGNQRASGDASVGETWLYRIQGTACPGPPPTPGPTPTSRPRPTAVATPGPTTQATIVLVPALVQEGSVTTAIGAGFPPGPVVLHWSQGAASDRSVTADTGGTFRVDILVYSHDQLGARSLVATAGPATAAAPMLVVATSLQPPGFLARR